MATFSPRPTEFEFPWFDTRSTYDQSLESAINANETAVGVADAKAVAAQGTADQAVLDADAAQSRADDAFTNAATAQSTAEQGVIDASSAQSTADTALTNAATAQGVADNAYPSRVVLGNADLDTVKLAGFYRQNNVNNVTLANNYPVAGFHCMLEVFPFNGAVGNEVGVVQRVTYGGGTGAVKGVYQRLFSASAWSRWFFIPTQRVDNTAGRAIYTWDETQNREQLIYGDTGWRNISELLDPKWELAPSGGVFAIRREFSTVTLRFRIRPLVTTPARAATRFLNAPLGFEPGAYTVSGVCSLGLVGGSTTVGFVHNGADLAGIDVNDFATSPTFAWSPANHLAGEISWSTSKGWPTVLPGTASGAIPHN